MTEVEDYYTYYVHFLGIPDYLFWNADISLLNGIAENNRAVGEWKNYIKEKEAERQNGKK